VRLCSALLREFASKIPIAGSAYTYAYASFGELLAWIIGWDLLVEYAIGNIAGRDLVERLFHGPSGSERHPHTAALDDGLPHRTCGL
jgi:hypothetical protein